MKLYKLEQHVNNGYDTYDSCIVCAENEEEAKQINPDSRGWNNSSFTYTSWVYKIEEVTVEYLGEAKEGLEKGIVLASFNAG